MSDTAAWVEATATCALAVGGIGAFTYAARTYAAQRDQLKLAREDSKLQRTPVLRGIATETTSGVSHFRLDVWLVSPEPLGHLRVAIVEARARDCRLGFTPGQNGVTTHTEGMALPVGWEQDVLRHQAEWHELLPGAAATWEMAMRSMEQGQGPEAGALMLQAECAPWSGGAPWLVPITVTVVSMNTYI
jgi:hypothetical protein